MEIVQNLLKGCGYVFQEGIDYSTVSDNNSEFEVVSFE